MLKDPDSRGAIMAIFAVISAIIAGIWAFYKYRIRNRKERVSEPKGRGGDGGSATIGGKGVALGGRGGRGTVTGGGSGGKGGDASVSGDGIAVGGDGGDCGLPWRPVLGAPSPLERLGGPFRTSEGIVDQYGIYLPGRGGVGGNPNVEIQFGGRAYRLVPLLNLLRIWSPTTIDMADATEPKSAQEFWERAMEIDPAATGYALEHVRRCENFGVHEKNLVPDPYAIQERLRKAEG